MKFQPELFRIDGEFAQTCPEDALLLLAARHEEDTEGIQSVREAINDIGVCAATSKPANLNYQEGVMVQAFGATNGALHGFVYKAKREDRLEVGVWVAPESRKLKLGKEALVCFLNAQTIGAWAPVDRRTPITTPEYHSNGSKIKKRLPESLVHHGWVEDEPVPVGLLLSALALNLSSIHPQDKAPLLAAISNRYRINLPDRDI
jgi:hypothetical protein